MYVQITDGTRTRSLGRRAVAGLVVLYFSLDIFVGLTSYRGQIASGQKVSFDQAFVEPLSDPTKNLVSSGGLDTFDGLVLAVNADRSAVGAKGSDPLKGILNLVPYQIWPNKPTFLSPVVTHYYTDFGGNAGIFLSGPGYAYLVWGGTVGIIAMWLLLGVSIGKIWHSGSSSIVKIVALYGVLRFFVAGDAFDLSYTLNILLALVLGRGLVWMAERLRLHIRGEGSAAPPGLRPSVPGDSLQTPYP